MGVIMSTDGNEEWPADAGWHFREGEAAFMGKCILLSPMQLKLLKRLVDAIPTKRPVRASDLRSEIWEQAPDEELGEDLALQQMVTQLRKRLKSGLGLSKRASEYLSRINPVVCVGRGATRAYFIPATLDKQVRLGMRA